jgi:hypothetical protein
MWKELIRLLSVEGQPLKTVLVQTRTMYFSFVKCLTQFM